MRGSISLSVVNFAKISSFFFYISLYFQYIWSVMMYVLSSPCLGKFPGLLNCWLFQWDNLLCFPVELRKSLSVLFSIWNVRQFYLVLYYIVFFNSSCLLSHMLFLLTTPFGFCSFDLSSSTVSIYLLSWNWISLCWIYWNIPFFPVLFFILLWLLLNTVFSYS